LGGRVPLDLRFWGPLEAKSFVRGLKIEPPGAPGRVFDLKCASCGHVRRCTAQSLSVTPGAHPACRADPGSLILTSAADLRLRTCSFKSS
jgi:hypothetical protein